MLETCDWLQKLMPRSHIFKLSASSISWCLSVLTILLFTAAKTIQFWNWNLEDGYIVYRIVRNLIAGFGWAYNVGDVYNPSTSVLNTVLIALASLPGVITIPAAAHLLGAISLAITGICICVIFSRSLGPLFSSLVALLAIEVLATSSTWGLETFLFIGGTSLFALFEALPAAHRKNSWYVLGFVILSRPDGVLIAAMKWLKELFVNKLLSIAGGLKCLLIIAPWAIFSLITFHQIFPDTLSNKMWQGRSGYWGQGYVCLRSLKDHLLIEDSLTTRRAYLKYVFIFGALGAILAVTSLFTRRREPLSCAPVVYLIAFGIIQQAAYVLLNVPAYHWYFAFFDFSMVIAAGYFFSVVFQLKVFNVIRGAPFFKRSLPLITCGGLSVLLVAASLTLAKAPSNMVDDSGNRHYLAASEVLKKPELPAGTLAVVEVGTLGCGVLSVAFLTS